MAKLRFKKSHFKKRIWTSPDEIFELVKRYAVTRHTSLCCILFFDVSVKAVIDWLHVLSVRFLHQFRPPTFSESVRQPKVNVTPMTFPELFITTYGFFLIAAGDIFHLFADWAHHYQSSSLLRVDLVWLFSYDCAYARPWPLICVIWRHYLDYSVCLAMPLCMYSI